jgi:transposase-like protein
MVPKVEAPVWTNGISRIFCSVSVWCVTAIGLARTTVVKRKWVRQAEVDQGHRQGVSTDERRRLRELEREVRELRRANEILKSAAAFFGAELDRPYRR